MIGKRGRNLDNENKNSIVKNENYKIHYYNGSFTLKKYYLRTILLSTALVLMICAGTLLMLALDNALPLVITLILFVVILVVYIVYINYFAKALYSVFVQDEDNALWMVTPMPSRRYYVYGGGSVPDIASAIATSKSDEYITGIIDDVKNGTYKFSIWSGGNGWIKMCDNRLIKETKNFFYVEAFITTRKKKSVRKTVKFVKNYEGLKRLLTDNAIK